MTTERQEVKSEYLIATYGDAMLDRGFTSIPNTLIYYRKRLGLTASEFEFIIAVMSLSWKKEKEIRDKEINPKEKNYYRQRQSLYAKGYLTFSSRNVYIGDRFAGTGTVYNFAGLKKAIEMLVEEDRAIQNMDAPVEQKYDEPSLFNEDVDENPIYPAKLLTDDKEIKELQLQNEFLEKFNKLHKELVNFRIDYIKSALYKKHLLDAFSNRKNNNIDEVLNSVKKSFFRLPIEERKSLRLQDLTKYALLETQEEKQNNTNEENKTQSEEYQAELINLIIY